jgi:hypothetical protein
MRAEARCATQRATVLVATGPRLEGTTGETMLAHHAVLAPPATERVDLKMAAFGLANGRDADSIGSWAWMRRTKH